MTSKRSGLVLAAGLLILPALNAESAADQGRRVDGQGAPAVFQEILERLQRIEEKLDTVEENQAMIEEDLNGPSTTAVFCTSQARGIELGAEYAAELKLELDLGIGWPNVGKIELETKPSIPHFLPIVLPVPSPFPPFITPVPIGAVPLPTAAKVGLAGGIGRGTDLCIEIPVKLSPEDEEQLLVLAEDINVSPVGFRKSKFQRRADRLLNYVARHVPGIQPDPAVEAAFDAAEAALQKLMDEGFAEGGTGGLDAFRDGSIKDLLTSLDVPISVASFMSDPEQILDALPDIGIGSASSDVAARAGLLERIDDWDCDELGLTPLLTRGRPYEALPGRVPGRGQDRLERFCGLLENDLPKFSGLRDAFADFPEGIVDAIGELFEKPSKGSFCNSTVGSRPIFDKYCGRP